MNKDFLIVKCNHCGVKNRVPQSRREEHPKCGKCAAPLLLVPFYDHVVIVSDHSFQAEVVSFPGPVLVDCWAPWCGPCKMVAPILDQLAGEYAGQLKITKINIDQNRRISSLYDIKSIPTLLFFKHGKLENSLPGAYPKHEIERHIRSII